MLIGSTTPSAALAAIAASMAEPPRSRTWAPACEARVWLVATMPWREITMERASDRSCALEDMEKRVERKPIAAVSFIELAIIAPSARSVVTCRH